MLMHPDQISTLLVGKTIAKVRHGARFDWPMLVYDITMTDGTIVEFSGNADNARIESVTVPGQPTIYPNTVEEEEDEHAM